MRLSEGIPFKTSANPPAHDQNINRANLHENEMVCDPVGLVQITTTPESRKYEKITETIQNPLPGLGPENTKKLPKKMAKKSPFLCFFGHFFVFSGPNPGRGILYFFRNFFLFSGCRGFCDLYQAHRVARNGSKISRCKLFRRISYVDSIESISELVAANVICSHKQAPSEPYRHRIRLNCGSSSELISTN